LQPYYHMLEDIFTPTEPIQFLSACGFVKTLTEDVISAMASNFGKPGTPFIQIRSLGGAVSRIASDATAFAHRDYEAILWMTAMMPGSLRASEAQNKRNQAWDPLKDHVSGTYINFLSDAGENSVANAYPPEVYTRLAEIKAAYDPDNLFHHNHNIRPEAKPTTA